MCQKRTLCAAAKTSLFDHLVGSDDLLEHSSRRGITTSPGGHARRVEINLSHGAAWKALISRYITVIPLIGDEPCIAMQSMSGWPLKKAFHQAMIANVGVAARPSDRAMPGAALPPPAQVSTS
jgi:hypothetical protein